MENLNWHTLKSNQKIMDSRGWQKGFLVQIGNRKAAEEQNVLCGGVQHFFMRRI